LFEDGFYLGIPFTVVLNSELFSKTQPRYFCDKCYRTLTISPLSVCGIGSYVNQMLFCATIL
jgi:hypothetical protein